MPKSEDYFKQSFKLPNDDLASHFARVRAGTDEIVGTPFANTKGDEAKVQKVLSEWDRILKPVSREWPTLYEFETDLRSKVGPMSVTFPLSKRLTDIDNYYDLISKDQSPVEQRALDAVVREWGRGLTAIRSEYNTLDKMKKSTSSGSPFYQKKRKVIDETYPCFVDNENGEVDQYLGLNDDHWKACAVLGWRGQEGGPKPEDTKQRVVWMFPFAVNLQELRVYQPLVEYAQEHEIVPAWIGRDAVNRAITKLFDTKGSKDLIVCTDFSKFDQHFNQVCQEGAKEILTRILPSNADAKAWLEQVYPIKYMIPLAYDWGKVRFGPHGMGSGSGGTNADETLLHRALQYEAAMQHGAELNPYSMCLGDDGILSYPGITVEDVTRAYESHGQECNISKQYASEQDCVYLRHWHHRDYRNTDGICVGVYSTFRALGRLMYQERWYDPDEWGPKMVALRQLSIIENCNAHPMREEFARFCMKRDKYRLGIDIPGFLDNIESEAKKAVDYMPDFLGYTSKQVSLPL